MTETSECDARLDRWTTAQAPENEHATPSQTLLSAVRGWQGSHRLQLESPRSVLMLADGYEFFGLTQGDNQLVFLILRETESDVIQRSKRSSPIPSGVVRGTRL